MPLGLMARTSVIVVCGLLPAVANAQIGSIGNKIKNKVTGQPSSSGSTNNSTTSSSPADCVKCVAKSMAITPDLVNRVIVGLKAELAERDREEQTHAQDGVGRLYVARDFALHCDTLKRADSVAQITLADKMRSDYQNASKYMHDFQARITDDDHKRCANQKAPDETDQAFFNMLNAVQARQDSVGAKAASFTVTEFAAAVELVSFYALNSQPNTFATRYPPSALQAMDAHKDELRSLVGREFNPGGAHKLSYQL